MSNHNSTNDNSNSAGDDNVTDSNSREPIFLLLLASCNFLILQFLYNIILKIEYLAMKCHSRI